MKPTIKRLAFCGLLATAGHASAAFNLAPDGDFSSGQGSWTEAADGGVTYSYPATGGHPDGYARMNFTTGAYAVIFSADSTLASLGLVAGETYDFKIDMIRFSGAAGTMGGLKIEFPGATPDNTGDMVPTVIGTGSTWETYSFPVEIPANATTVRFTPLWGGANTDIGYDNVGVEAVEIPPPPPSLVIPNGDFESGSDSWFETNSEETTFSYPATGGNPDGHAVITNSGVGFGTLTANNNQPLTLQSLGLETGVPYIFQQDMKILDGARIGGFRVDFYAGATQLAAPNDSTGNMFPTLVGDGSTWETYSFEVTIPAGADGIKLLSLWGNEPFDSQPNSVGYDNVRIIPPGPFTATITTGTVVSWEALYPESEYQPQRSLDEETWEDFGPRIIGNTVSMSFDPEGAPFYRVDEYIVNPVDAAQEGGFETPGLVEVDCPDRWACITNNNQGPTRITSDFRSGAASARIAVQNDAGGAANTSELQQNVANEGGSITPGSTYDFSFWAKQVSSGVSYVQQYRLQWLTSGGDILPGSLNFENFTGGDGTWEEIKVTGLLAPAGANSALIQIFGATGAVPGIDAKGEVLIDDVSLTSASSFIIETIDATAAPGVNVSWPTIPGFAYQVKSSPNLENFMNVGAPIAGDGTTKSLTELLRLPDGTNYYQVEQTN